MLCWFYARCNGTHTFQKVQLLSHESTECLPKSLGNNQDIFWQMRDEPLCSFWSAVAFDLELSHGCRFCPVSFLLCFFVSHLYSVFFSDDHDTTVLSWAVGQSRGEGLQVSADTVTVETEGTYFIYSQVLYKDTTWVMGHVIMKRHKGAETKLMKCLKSMPSNVSQPLNTCYTAGIYFLESGSTLQLYVPRKSAELILTAHATFMGLFNI
uniref:TNF superfamily member 13 n=1 Tax=Sinocyclocheilus grahami TaxID=75366 RepID=A0A672LZE6_SINGR